MSVVIESTFEDENDCMKPITLYDNFKNEMSHLGKRKSGRYKNTNVLYVLPLSMTNAHKDT